MKREKVGIMGREGQIMDEYKKIKIGDFKKYIKGWGDVPVSNILA